MNAIVIYRGEAQGGAIKLRCYLWSKRYAPKDPVLSQVRMKATLQMQGCFCFFRDRIEYIYCIDHWGSIHFIKVVKNVQYFVPGELESLKDLHTTYFRVLVQLALQTMPCSGIHSPKLADEWVPLKTLSSEQ